METTTEESPARKARLGKTRIVIAVLLLPVLLLATIGATTIRFAGGRVLDEGAFASYASASVNERAVTDAVGSASSDKVLDLVDPEGRLPEKKREAIKDGVAKAMQSDIAKEISVQVFSSAHRGFLALAERDDLTGKEVFDVDLLPLVYVALAELSTQKTIPQKVAPLEDANVDSKSLAKTLSRALGRKVAANAGTVRVIGEKDGKENKGGVSAAGDGKNKGDCMNKGDESTTDGENDNALLTVHDCLNVYHNGVLAVTVVALVLASLMVLLFTRRRRGVITVCSTALVAVVIPWIALGQLPSRIAESIDDEKGSAIARAFLVPLTNDVRSRLLVVGALLIAAILGVVFSPKLAAKVRSPKVA